MLRCAATAFSKTSRIEENQVLSMKRWFQTGNTMAMFWLKLPDGTISVIIVNSEKELDELLERKRSTKRKSGS